MDICGLRVTILLVRATGAGMSDLFDAVVDAGAVRTKGIGPGRRLAKRESAKRAAARAERESAAALLVQRNKAEAIRLRLRGVQLSDILLALGVDGAIFSRWQQADRSFGDAWDRADRWAAEYVAEALHRGALQVDKNPKYTQAAIFLLRNARPERWAAGERAASAGGVSVHLRVGAGSDAVLAADRERLIALVSGGGLRLPGQVDGGPAGLLIDADQAAGGASDGAADAGTDQGSARCSQVGADGADPASDRGCARAQACAGIDRKPQ